MIGMALAREIEEELEITGPWTVRAVGLLNDDTTDVGSVHFGLVHVVRAEGDVRVRETHTLTGGFVGREELHRLCGTERDSFESWSTMLVDRLDDVLRP